MDEEDRKKIEEIMNRNPKYIAYIVRKDVKFIDLIKKWNEYRKT